VRRWISAHLSEEAVREKVTVARALVAPGSEAQIDYGRLGMWLDPFSGRRVAVWAFVMVLSCSRHIFVHPVIKMHQSSWCASQVAAFEFFGGVPARLVPDNLKAGVPGPTCMTRRSTRPTLSWPPTGPSGYGQKSSGIRNWPHGWQTLSPVNAPGGPRRDNPRRPDLKQPRGRAP
jgi:transposase